MYPAFSAVFAEVNPVPDCNLKTENCSGGSGFNYVNFCISKGDTQTKPIGISNIIPLPILLLTTLQTLHIICFIEGEKAKLSFI